MTNAASEPTTPQPISQPAGTSPTISPARPPARIPSASAAKPQAGTTNISPASSQRDFLHPIPLVARGGMGRDGSAQTVEKLRSLRGYLARSGTGRDGHN